MVESPIFQLTRTRLTPFSPLLDWRYIHISSVHLVKTHLRVFVVDDDLVHIALSCRAWEDSMQAFLLLFLVPLFHGAYISSCK